MQDYAEQFSELYSPRKIN